MARKRENDYFEMLVENVSYSCRAAECLLENLQNFSSVRLAENLERLHQVEHQGDQGKHRLLEKLLREFLPPIEREDIMTVTNRIDDVTDELEEVVRSLYMFRVQKLRPEAVQLAELICRCCQAMKEMMEAFRDFRKSTVLRDKMIAINQLEEEGDQLYTDAVRRLYTDEKDATQIFIWTNLFGRLERCCDCCEHVADAVEMAVMKNT